MLKWVAGLKGQKVGGKERERERERGDRDRYTESVDHQSALSSQSWFWSFYFQWAHHQNQHCHWPQAEHKPLSASTPWSIFHLQVTNLITLRWREREKRNGVKTFNERKDLMQLQKPMNVLALLSFLKRDLAWYKTKSKRHLTESNT